MDTYHKDFHIEMLGRCLQEKAKQGGWNGWIDSTKLISARLATNFERGSIMVNMNSITEELKRELAFTEEELKELEKAKEMPIAFDEDCPEITPEKAIKFRRVNPSRRLASRNLA